jgi:hypothetical protein
MEWMKEILPQVNTIIAAVAVYALQRWVHIRVRRERVQQLLDALTQEIVAVEVPGTTGVAKKSAVIERVLARFEDPRDTVFTEARRSLLKRVFGSIEIAVEKAFQLSHLSKKGSVK